jgi:hypothetical protein
VRVAGALRSVRPHTDVCALHTASFRPLRILGIAVDVPELTVEMPESFTEEHLVHTTYVDRALRITRSTDGIVYVFVRDDENDARAGLQRPAGSVGHA